MFGPISDKRLQKYISYELIISIGIVLGINSYIHDKKNSSVSSNEYSGREIKNTVPTDGIINYYGLDETTKVCPYSCRLSTKPYKKCKDNRSIFAFTGSLDPDERLDWSKDEVKLKDIQDWKHNDQGYMCPPKKKPFRWPYEVMCPDFRQQCTSASPSMYKTKEINDNIKEISHNKCVDYYEKYDDCPIYDEISDEARKSELRFKYNTTGEIFGKAEETIKVDCTKEEPELDIFCPFPENEVPLPNIDDFNQRHDINLWSDAYGILAGTVPRRRLSKHKQAEWQNLERYEIINQNYYNDKFS